MILYFPDYFPVSVEVFSQCSAILRWLLLSFSVAPFANFPAQVWPPFGNAKRHRMHRQLHLHPSEWRPPSNQHPPPLFQPFKLRLGVQTTKPTIWLSQWELQHLATTTIHLGPGIREPHQPGPQILGQELGHSVNRPKNSGTLPSRVRILSTCVAVCFNGQFLTLNGHWCRAKASQFSKKEQEFLAETLGLRKIHKVKRVSKYCALF